MKIVINKCYGGFGVSHKGIMRWAELKGITLYPFTEEKLHDFSNQKYIPYIEGSEIPFFGVYYATKPLTSEGKYEEDSWFWYRDIERNDPCLVQVVEEMGDEASGYLSALKIVEVPDGIEWEIDDYDGMESVQEVHQSWG